MHEIEPYFNWQRYYDSSEDERSPFYGREYKDFEFNNRIYDHIIHPEWDNIGSPTLFAKIVYAEYDQHFCVIELIGEWNDTLHNDIMHFKRNVLDVLLSEGINKFMLIGENVLIFHSSDDCYYEEWFDEIEDGWIAMVNFNSNVLLDIQEANLDQYVLIDRQLDDLNWRTCNPSTISAFIDSIMQKRLTY